MTEPAVLADYTSPFKEQFVLVGSTNKIHIRYRIGNRTVDDGRCGIDDNWEEVDESFMEGLDRDSFCQFCFPDR